MTDVELLCVLLSVASLLMAVYTLRKKADYARINSPCPPSFMRGCFCLRFCCTMLL